MVRKAKRAAALPTRVQAAVPASDAPAPAVVVERPDGYYWQSASGQQEFGPFESYEQACMDRDAIGDEAVAPGDTLQQTEREIGIADWIDAETGEPAEGQSPPHLQED